MIANTVVFVGGSTLLNKPAKTVRGFDAWRMKETHVSNALKFLEAAASEHAPFEREARRVPIPDELQGDAALAMLRARAGGEEMRVEIVRDRAVKRTLSGDFALTPLVVEWARNKNHTTRTMDAMTRYVRRFVESVGDLVPSEVTRAHVVKFRDALRDQGKKPDNIQEHLNKLNALFNFAMGEGIFVANPAHGVKAQGRERRGGDKRQGFTSGQVKAIFKALKNETDFAWIVKLLAYHGARSGEISQLRCTDIMTEHGVALMRINGRDGKSVKNAGSVRDVPLHPAVQRGIMAFAKKVEKAHGPEAWLFQTSWKHRAATSGPWHWFQKYGNGTFLRKTVGITDKSIVMHSFRHRFRTLCREVEMPESVSASLMGHKLGGGEHGAYGGAPSLKKRAEWLAKVDPVKG
jgi:integrase